VNLQRSPCRSVSVEKRSAKNDVNKSGRANHADWRLSDGDNNIERRAQFHSTVTNKVEDDVLRSQQEGHGRLRRFPANVDTSVAAAAVEVKHLDGDKKRAVLAARYAAVPAKHEKAIAEACKRRDECEAAYRAQGAAKNTGAALLNAWSEYHIALGVRDSEAEALRRQLAALAPVEAGNCDRKLARLATLFYRASVLNAGVDKKQPDVQISVVHASHKAEIAGLLADLTSARGQIQEAIYGGMQSAALRKMCVEITTRMRERMGSVLPQLIGEIDLILSAAAKDRIGRRRGSEEHPLCV
jgi:hypothetical protein